MKQDKTSREHREEAIEDLRKGKLYLQKEWMSANAEAKKLLGEAVQLTIDKINELQAKLDDETL